MARLGRRRLRRGPRRRGHDPVIRTLLVPGAATVPSSANARWRIGNRSCRREGTPVFIVSRYLEGTALALTSRMKSPVLVLFAILLLAACSDSNHAVTRLTSCPPAPLPLPQHGTACDFTTAHSYSPPHVFENGTADPFNYCSCACIDGRIEVMCTTVGCGGECEAPPCEAGVVEGQSCGASTNGECAASFTDAGHVDRKCACDMPGPVWRCVSVGDAD